MINRRTFISFLILAALAGAGLTILNLRFSKPESPAASSASAPPTLAQEVAEAKEANAGFLSPRAARAASDSAAANFAETFASPLGFSFAYPDSLKVGESDNPETGETTILAQNAAEHIGIQISARPWSGASKITPSEVTGDLPQIRARSFTAIALDGAPGLAFAAADPNFGDSLQVWLARGGYLYQISTYAADGPLLSKILGTWRWKR